MIPVAVVDGTFTGGSWLLVTLIVTMCTVEVGEMVSAITLITSSSPNPDPGSSSG